jgi:membrane fusion protein (multidrug efflux system)
MSMTRFHAVVIASALLCLLAGCSERQTPAGVAPEVYVTEVVQRDVPVYMEIVGQTAGSQDVEIRARVEGFLDSVSFREGAFVHKGDLLYQIDPKPLEANLAQARAMLATNKARLDQATISVNRLKPLADQQAVSQQELDNALATQNAAIAQVDAGRASVEKAELDLGYTRIVSPIDGIVGTTLVKPGNLVGRGESTLLTTVSQIDPIIFKAGISETDYLKVMRQKGVQRRRGDLNQTPIQLILGDLSVYPQPGYLEAVERAVDPTTGTLALQFQFPNAEGMLRPGLYGRARFEFETRRGALLVPQRAVQELQNLHTVAVVGPDNKVAMRTVTVGPRVDSLWVIEEGVRTGEKVVVEGLQRVREGITVVATPQPPPAPSGEAEPLHSLEGVK